MSTAQITKEELAQMEATLQAGLEICHKLKERIERVSTPLTARKGLTQKQITDLVLQRRRRMNLSGGYSK